MVKLILHSQDSQIAREGAGDSIKYAYNYCFSKKLSQNCKFQTLDTISRRGYASAAKFLIFILVIGKKGSIRSGSAERNPGLS